MIRPFANKGDRIPRPPVPPDEGELGQNDHRHTEDGRREAEIDAGGLRRREEAARRGDRQVPRRNEGDPGMVLGCAL